MSLQSQPLDSGKYAIYSHARGKPYGVGLVTRGPFRVPIHILPYPVYEFWDVKHLEGHRYLLTVDHFVTKAEGDRLWSYDHHHFPQVKGTEWIIERNNGARYYTITDHEGKGWTWQDQEGPEQIVTLEHVPDNGAPTTQLWIFRRLEDLE